MSFAPPKPQKPPKIQRISLMQWLKGYESNLDDDRKDQAGLKLSQNSLIYQNGTIRPRPSLIKYGDQPIGVVLGETYSFVDPATKLNWEINVQAVPINEVQSVSITGTPTGGTFTLTFGGHTTAGIAFNAIASVVQTALQGLTSIGSGNVTVTGGPLPGTAMTVTFTGRLANQDLAQMTTSGAGLTGGTTPASHVSTTTDGGPVASVCVRKDGATWTTISGKTYDTAAKCHFIQVEGEVLVMNGTDNLSYYDIASTAVIPFTQLDEPVITSVTPTGLTGSNFVYGYRVSASNQGNTKASDPVTATVGITRNQWSGIANGQYVTIVWPRITGAQRYSIYVSAADGTGLYYYLDTVPDPGTGSTVTYVDDSSVALNQNSLAPEDDSTAGPRVTRGENILGQVYLIGDADHFYRIWFGGTGKSALDFSTFDGGGWVDVDVGGRNFPASIKGFRDGHGNPVATGVFKGTSGRGKIIHLAQTSTTLGDTVITYLALQEANGQDGTVSPDGVIYYLDSLWYPSVDNFNSTGTKAQLQNILSTTKFSQGIQPDVNNLSPISMENCVGLEFQGRLYWSLPVGSNTNNQVWVCDLNRGGVWTNPWFMNADWMWLYDSNDGVTHMMVMSNNTQYELNYNQLTQDDTTPFSVDIESGLIKFSPDGEDWGSVVDVTFVFERPQGEINMNVTGFTESGPLQTLGTQVYDPSIDFTGWNEIQGWNNTSYPWNAVVNIPTVFADPRVEEIITIGTEMKWLTWEVSSHNRGVDFQLADVVIRYVDIGVIDH